MMGSYLNNCASHSRYFSDELDAPIFYKIPKWKNKCLLTTTIYVKMYLSKNSVIKIRTE